MSDLLAAQRAAWERGERERVEAFVSGRPGLSREQLLDLIYNEIVLREECGEAPSIDEYVDRFPSLGRELRLQFEVHQALRSERSSGKVALLPTAPAKVAPLPTVPGYEIEEVLGRGGMGVVYAATQTSLGRRIALKLLPFSTGDDRELIARFQAEARTASTLNHPHIAMIFDFGVHERRQFIVMELVVGRTLAKLTRAPRTIAQCVGYVRQVAEALASVHAAGIVHRDLKPANIMIREDDLVKVLDFGVARLAARGPRDDPASIAGTPRYMSPEQLRGDAIEAASDVYSLGLVLHELLTDQLPEPRSSGAAALAPSPQLTPPAITPRLEGLVHRMLASDPQSRPTMAEVARELAGTTEPVRQRGSLLRPLLHGTALLGARVIARILRTPPVPSGRRASASIVVMPFTTLGDAESAYFSAGVTEDITSMLTRAPDITVRSNTAALAYKDTPVDVRRIGRELDVGYVLEGSVRKEARQMRITARLVDARTGVDVWAERIDRTGVDPWALQDEIAGRIVAALTGEYGQLKRAQYQAAWGIDSTGLEEYDVYLRGHELYMKFTSADNDRAGEVWQRGLVTFPDSALLKTKLGCVHLLRPFLFFRDDAANDYARASELVRSVLAKPHVSPLERRLAHWLFAYVCCQEGNHDRALQEMQTTLKLAPYDMFQLGDLSTIPILAGRPSEALCMLDKALEADPANRAFYQQLRGWAFSVAGRHAESVKALDEGIPLPMVPLLQAVNHVELGQLEQARRLVAEALAQQPDLTLAKWESANPYRDHALLKKQLTDLAVAGLR